MKKYLSGMIGIMLAIGFCAFTTHSPAKKINRQDPLYWYHVSGPNIGALADASEFTKDDAMAEITDCQDQVNLCLVGASTSNLQGLPISGNINEDESFRIKQTE